MSARQRHLSLDQLDSFVAVAEAGSLTAAAERLGISQPTVSQHLQRLEARLQRSLVLRGRGGATLTQDGERLLPLARGLLRLDRAFAPGPQAELRLGACSNIGVYILPELLRGLREAGERLPELRIGPNPDIVRELLAGELDVALLEWWEPQPGFDARDWRREPVVAILSAEDPLSRCDPLTLEMLRGAVMLGGEPGTGTGRLLQAALGAAAPLAVSLSLGSTEAVKRAVAAGLGVSLVLRATVEEAWLEARGLVGRGLTPPLCKTLQLVWRAGLPEDAPLLGRLAEAGDQPSANAAASRSARSSG